MNGPPWVSSIASQVPVTRQASQSLNWVVFYDGLTDKTYYIHTMIFHPGNNKLILLRQLEIIAKSFFVEKV